MVNHLSILQTQRDMQTLDQTWQLKVVGEISHAASKTTDP